MLIILIILNTVLFIVLSGIHLYWLAGGKWGLALSVPSNPLSHNLIFKPSVLTTLVVAFGLLVFALVTMGNANVFLIGVDDRYFRYGDVFISIIFMMRAIGDFRYVGFFKSVRNTPFAKMDAKIYSPLCLLISITGFIIFFLTSRAS